MDPNGIMEFNFIIFFTKACPKFSPNTINSENFEYIVDDLSKFLLVWKFEGKVEKLIFCTLNTKEAFSSAKSWKHRKIYEKSEKLQILKKIREKIGKLVNN